MRFGAHGEATSRRDLRCTESAHGMEVASPCRVRAVCAPRQAGSPRVGCWVFGRPAAGTGAPTSRLPHHWHSDTLSHACWVGLAAHKADSFSGCGQACAYTTLLVLRTGCTVCPSPGTGCQQQGREDHRRPHDASPTGRAPRLWRLNDDLKPVACGATRRPHGQVSVAAGMSQLQIENYAQVIGNLRAFFQLGVAAAKHRRVLLPTPSCPGGPWWRGQSSSQGEDGGVGMGVWG